MQGVKEYPEDLPIPPAPLQQMNQRFQIGRMADEHANLTAWDELPKERQTALLIDYGRYLDQLPPTCSLEEKNVRFARWLAEQNVFYPLDS